MGLHKVTGQANCFGPIIVVVGCGYAHFECRARTRMHYRTPADTATPTTLQLSSYRLLKKMQDLISHSLEIILLVYLDDWIENDSHEAAFLPLPPALRNFCQRPFCRPPAQLPNTTKAKLL